MNESGCGTNVWTGCVSQEKLCVESGSRWYVSGLFDRLAGRGLDGNTHASLVFLTDRLACNHSCHQTLDAFIDPFHAFCLSRPRMRSRLRSPWPRDAGRRRPFVAQDALGDPPVCLQELSPVCCDEAVEAAFSVPNCGGRSRMTLAAWINRGSEIFCCLARRCD